MGYILSEEQMGMVQLAKDFANREVKPIVAECDEKGEMPLDG